MQKLVALDASKTKKTDDFLGAETTTKTHQNNDTETTLTTLERRMASSEEEERLHEYPNHQRSSKRTTTTGGGSSSQTTTTKANGKTLIAFVFGFLLSFILFHADAFNHRQSIVNRWRGISNDLVLEREHCRQVLAEHKDALSSVHEEFESLKEKHQEASGALKEKHDMWTHASSLLEEKNLELEHKTTQLEVMKEALSEVDVDGHNGGGSGVEDNHEEEEEDDALSEEEPAEQPSGRSSRGGGKHSSKRSKRGGHGSKKSSSKPHGGEEHGEEDLDEGVHDEVDDTASAEEPLQEEMDVSTE